MSFTIHAHVINERVRELVLAGSWPDAQRFLRRCMPGMSTDQAYRLMSGTTSLVNVGLDGRPTEGASASAAFKDEFDPARDERETEFSRTLAARWAGTLKVRDACYRPYAYVSSFGKDDLDVSTDPKFARAAARYMADNQIVSHGRRGGARKAEFRTYAVRPVYYVDDPDQDIGLKIDLRGIVDGIVVPHTPVLFRPVTVLPPWVEPLRDPKAALLAYLETGLGLEERGDLKLNGIAWAKAMPTVGRDDVVRRREHVVHAEQDAETKRRADCTAAAEAVREQMKLPGRGEWLEFDLGEPPLRVPRAPFEHWSLDRCGAGHLAPPWDVCSKPGLKAGMESGADDPMHTDWMLGAGLDPMTLRWYGADPEAETIRDAAFKAMGEIQRERLSFECTVLAGTGHATGRAWVADRKRQGLPMDGDVVVLPDASPDWLETVMAACGRGRGALVVAKGGAMAHLIVETMAKDVPIVRVEGARRKYVDGQTLSIDCGMGMVAILPVDLEPSDDPEENAAFMR